MHAVYAFLCRGDDPMSGFTGSSFHDALDENNWYQEMASVNRKGAVQRLCPEGDYRERAWLLEKLPKQPQESRWDAAVKFAEEIVLYELGLAILCLTPREAWKTEEEEYKNLDQAVAALRKKIAQTAHQVEAWTIHRAGSLLAQAEDRSGPFTRVCTNAYNSIRAMVLLNDGLCVEDEDATILFVDIHT